MPFNKYTWVEKGEILTSEEITRLANLFVQLGVDKIRLTGGETLVCQGLEGLIEELSAIAGLKDLTLTTNGSLLAEKAPTLAAAGLKRINVSLDTLNPEKFRRITQRGDLAKVLQGLFAAKRYGLHPIKINTVVERGVNDDEIIPLVDFARRNGFTIRFIEYMDVGTANNWRLEKVVSKREILQRIHAYFPLREVGRKDESAPSVDYQFVDGSGEVGVVASVTEPFCSTCTRVRLTADGKLVTCLFSERGHDLKPLLRNGAADEDIKEFVSTVWKGRRDRYSEERFEAIRSVGGYRAKAHKKLEMITLGG